jgi:acetyltransferase-like isoleucine patch superfamily enzyme
MRHPKLVLNDLRYRAFLFRELPERRLKLRSRLLRPYLKRRFATLGENVIIGRFRILKGAHKISIADGVIIYPDCSVSVEQSAWDADGPRIEFGRLSILQSNVTMTCAESIVLEDYASVGTNSLISDNDHIVDGSHDSVLFTPIKTAPVRLGRGAWVGHNCVILRGVTLGEHCIVGAGSVVTKDVPAYAIAVGSPARVIGQVPHPGAPREDALT